MAAAAAAATAVAMAAPKALLSKTAIVTGSGAVRRSGMLGLKLGMVQSWTDGGRRVALTAIHMRDNQVVRVRTPETDGKYAVQVGAVDHPRPHKLHNGQRVMYERAGVPPKRHLREYDVSPEAVVPAGTRLSVAHFVPGQFVDVIGTTTGKGFMGVMRRHGMKGSSASHGNTKAHRKMGASGGGTNPGRVFPGKRMAGHMGCDKVLTRALMVFRIDTRWNMLYLLGSVPGKLNVGLASLVSIIKLINSLLDVRDSWRTGKTYYKLPVPTAAPDFLPLGTHTVDQLLPIPVVPPPEAVVIPTGTPTAPAAGGGKPAAKK